MNYENTKYFFQKLIENVSEVIREGNYTKYYSYYPNPQKKKKQKKTKKKTHKKTTFF